MRCPDCNKFVSLEMGDPEVASLEISEEGNVLVEISIVRNCADCGTELKRADLSIEHDLSEETLAHLKESHPAAYRKMTGEKAPVETDAPAAESAAETETEEDEVDFDISEDGVEPIEEGGGRYKKSYFGAEVAFTVTCNCCKKEFFEGVVSDKVAASEMEECV